MRSKVWYPEDLHAPERLHRLGDQISWLSPFLPSAGFPCLIYGQKATSLSTVHHLSAHRCLSVLGWPVESTVGLSWEPFSAMGQWAGHCAISGLFSFQRNSKRALAFSLLALQSHICPRTRDSPLTDHLQCTLKSRTAMMPPALSLWLRIVLAIRDLFQFHENLRIAILSSGKNFIDILMDIALNV